VSPDAPEVDLLANGVRLPLPDSWADEILAVHMLEHVPPAQVPTALREWFRVLRPGGVVRIHTPNAQALGQVLALAENSERYWAALNAIYGYGLAPQDASGPTSLTSRPDHKVLFSPPVLKNLLSCAGFVRIWNLTGACGCYHAVAWEPYVPGLCLAVEARKPEQ
jgi:SAM-dependent methyltransferase